MKKLISDFAISMFIILIVYGMITVIQNALHFTNK